MSSQTASSLKSGRIAKITQACDCCHTRKIRCDGKNPCTNCTATQLQCTYLAVPKKKGPKGRRVTKEIPRKSIQRPFTVPQSINPRIHVPPPPPVTPPPLLEQKALPDLDMFDNPEIGVLDFQPSPLVTIQVMTSCLDAFFVHKYPIMPILDRHQIYALLPDIDKYPEAYGLITACCAVIVLSPEIIEIPISGTGLSHETLPSCEFLLGETVRARQFFNYIETPSITTIQTSFFLFAALFCQDKDNSAWFYIREAMTILQLLRLHDELTYSNTSDPNYSTYCRRTFWLLFITERAYALQRHRPLTLQRTIDLPTVDPGPEATILSGFIDLVTLFQNFDDKFIALWNLSSTSSTENPESLIRLQQILKLALPNVSQRTEIQQADLLVSRQWLKTMVWQLCVSKRLLSSNTTDESMSFHYPVTIARDVVLVSRLLPPKAFEANGIGILEKVFDIGCSLADVLLLSRGSVNQPTGMEIGPRDYLMQLLSILGTVMGGSSKYLSLLASKADECLQVRIRGSLTSSDDSHDIHEVDDDDEVSGDIVYNDNDIGGYDNSMLEATGILENQTVFGPEIPDVPYGQITQYASYTSESRVIGEVPPGSGDYDMFSPEWIKMLQNGAESDMNVTY